jgi:CheY-like chemotaxis protein
MKIAVLIEDTTQSELVCQVLGGIGHACTAFADGEDMLAQLRQPNLLRKDSFDMLVMDWQLSGATGEEIVRQSRARFDSAMPVLFMTSRSSEDDIVAGMNAGADDYLIKPMRRGELVARVQALLRRAYPSQNGTEQLQFGPTYSNRPGRLLVDGGGRRDAEGIRPRPAVLPQYRPPAVARLHPRIGLGARPRPCRRAPWTPTFRACATSCACARKTVSAWCRCTATATAWSSWAPDPVLGGMTV